MNAIRRVVVTSRPRFWLYLGGPVIVGLSFAADAPSDLIAPVAFVLLGYFLLPANMYLYGVNDMFDAEIDRFNPKKSGRERRFEGELVTVAAVVLSGLLGLGVVALVPAESRVWILGFLVLGAAYSVPPIRLKSRPLFDSLSNGLYIVPGVGAYAALTGELPPIAIIVGAWAWTMAMHTYSAVPDIGPDRAGGIDTTATVLGHRLALVYCAVVWALAAVAIGLVDVRGGALLAIYPMTAVLATHGAVDVERLYWAYPALNTGVGMVFAVYGLIGVFHG